jgi:hypothetical protein
VKKFTWSELLTSPIFTESSSLVTVVKCYANRTDCCCRFSSWQCAPNKDNLAFIKQCQQSLSADVRFDALKIDSSGCRMSFCIGDYNKAFTLIVQRKAIQGQTNLELSSKDDTDEVSINSYIYWTIATNREQCYCGIVSSHLVQTSPGCWTV